MLTGIKPLVWLKSSDIFYTLEGKVFPLQARCGPEGG